jgi:hypothetical protein
VRVVADSNVDVLHSLIGGLSVHVVRDIHFGVRIAFDAVAAQFAGRNRMRMNVHCRSMPLRSRVSARRRAASNVLGRRGVALGFCAIGSSIRRRRR